MTKKSCRLGRFYFFIIKSKIIYTKLILCFLKHNQIYNKFTKTAILIKKNHSSIFINKWLFNSKSVFYLVFEDFKSSFSNCDCKHRVNTIVCRAEGARKSTLCFFSVVNYNIIVIMRRIRQAVVSNYY